MWLFPVNTTTGSHISHGQDVAFEEMLHYYLRHRALTYVVSAIYRN